MTKPTAARPRLDAQNNPGNARWCDDHLRLECAKGRKAQRGLCHSPAIRGESGCKTHNGFSRKVSIARGEARITAWSALGSNMGAVDANMAVLGVLQMTWLRLGAYSELLRRQVAAEGGETGELGGSELVSASGLIGHKIGAAGKDGNLFNQSEEIRGLVALEAAERDRTVKFAKTAHDMGISTRLTNLAEKWGDVVATRITALLGELMLTPEQEAQVPALIQVHLGSIDMETMGGSGS